jgi:hypothetical protein
MKQEIAAIVDYDCGDRIGTDPLGTAKVKVPASSWWVNSGLFLRQGQKATISAVGEWTIWEGETEPFPPSGHEQLSMNEGCRKGSLVARVGLYHGGGRHCVGMSSTITAETDGIVYLAMNDNASPTFHGGEIEATITSTGDRAPTIPYNQAEAFDYCSVGSGWVEIESQEHVTLTVPAPLAASHVKTTKASLDFLDQSYKLQTELSGGEVPYLGSRIRYYPDYALTDVAWVLAENPIRYDPKNLNAVFPSKAKILDLTAASTDSWDFVQGMGVDFSRIHGNRYQAGSAGAQAWAGMFAMYTMENMGRADGPANVCADKDNFLQNGTFSVISQDPWLQMCMFLQVKDDFGWDLLSGFFLSLPDKYDWDSQLAANASDQDVWSWVKQRLDQVQKDRRGFLDMMGPLPGAILDDFKL